MDGNRTETHRKTAANRRRRETWNAAAILPVTRRARYGPHRAFAFDLFCMINVKLCDHKGRSWRVLDRVTGLARNPVFSLFEETLHVCERLQDMLAETFLSRLNVTIEGDVTQLKVL